MIDIACNIISVTSHFEIQRLMSLTIIDFRNFMPHTHEQYTYRFKYSDGFRLSHLVDSFERKRMNAYSNFRLSSLWSSYSLVQCTLMRASPYRIRRTLRSRWFRCLRFFRSFLVNRYHRSDVFFSISFFCTLCAQFFFFFSHFHFNFGVFGYFSNNPSEINMKR